MNVEIISHTQDFFGTIAKAASVCYDSEPSLKIVRGCIKNGHCYDEETEVLTSEGFKFWKDITYEDKIATVNPDDRTFHSFENPLALIQYPYNGIMYHFNSKTVDLCVTPGHKLYCSLNSQKHRSHPKFELMSANTIVKTTNRFTDKPVYKKPLRMVTAAINNKLTAGNPLYKLYGFFIGDGHLENKNTGRISFHLKKERKIKYLQNICKECDLKLTEKPNNEYILKLLGMEKFYNYNKEKTFPLDFLNMSREDFEYFYEGLINSDGSIQDTSIQYSTTSKELVDRLQALFSINNITHTVKEKISNNTNWKNLYTINISKSVLKYPMFNDSRSKKMATEINYNGMVYCAEISTGLLVVRRNGKVCLSGNCSVLEHSSFTFKIEGISRACSHQLVRHRMASYSQRSQRYCKENNVTDYILPSNSDKEVYLSFYDKEQEYYDYLINEGEKPEDARMVLPNACPTTIFVTMNLRSLAHFMNERLCSRAQSEIRNMAILMKNIILESPDFTMEEKEIFKMLFVPKCEANTDLHICPEQKSCGRSKTAKELNKILNFFENYEREREKERDGDYSLKGDKMRQYLRSLGYDRYIPTELSIQPDWSHARIVPLYNNIEDIPSSYVYPETDKSDKED